MVRSPIRKDFIEAAKTVSGSSDAFGKLLTNNPRTQLDIASQYNFSPERLRLFNNGSRQFVQYGDNTNFTDTADSYTLQPDGGDTLHIESAESSTYVVGTEMQATFAFQLNQSLTGDDTVKVGPYNGSDGWYLEHRGDHANDRTVDLVVERNGTRTVLRSDVELDRPLTDYCRYAVNFNWYGVGNQQWIQTYTDDGEQFNEEFAKTSRDGVKGPQTGNLNLWYEVTADASTSGLELDCGSMSFTVQSNADQLVRGKSQLKTLSVPTGNDTWHPIYAIRLDPDDPNVNARLNEFDVLNYGNNNALVEMIAVSVDPSLTDASNWSTPGYQHDPNSALEETESVSQIPDTDGNQVTPDSSTSPGGYTLSAAALSPTGINFSQGASQATQTTVKRQLLSSDVIVFLARSPSADANVTFDFVVEQDW